MSRKRRIGFQAYVFCSVCQRNFIDSDRNRLTNWQNKKYFIKTLSLSSRSQTSLLSSTKQEFMIFEQEKRKLRRLVIVSKSRKTNKDPNKSINENENGKLRRLRLYSSFISCSNVQRTLLLVLSNNWEAMKANVTCISFKIL